MGWFGKFVKLCKKINYAKTCRSNKISNKDRLITYNRKRMLELTLDSLHVWNQSVRDSYAYGIIYLMGEVGWTTKHDWFIYCLFRKLNKFFFIWRVFNSFLTLCYWKLWNKYFSLFLLPLKLRVVFFFFNLIVIIVGYIRGFELCLYSWKRRRR